MGSAPPSSTTSPYTFGRARASPWASVPSAPAHRRSPPLQPYTPTYALSASRRRQARLRRSQRYWTAFYNVLTVGELVYFLVGLYMVQWQVADLADNPLLGPGNVGVINLG